MMKYWAAVQRMILKDAVSLQAIPAPTFDEKERGEYVFGRFEELGLEQVEIDTIGNVYGFLPGGSEPSMVLSAHLDTVHSREIDHSIVRNGSLWIGPGIGDNTIALATMLGLIYILRKRKSSLPGGIWFVANVSEEGLGNLKGIKAVAERFSNKVRAYIVLEGLGLGVIFHRGLGVKRYRVSVQTRGGHSWGDYGSPSAIHELAKFISKLCEIRFANEPRTSLNVGKIAGGTTVNSIAQNASCEIDLRSINPDTLTELEQAVLRLINEQKSRGVHFHAAKIGERPYGDIPATHWLVELAQQAVYQAGLRPVLATGSTDANYPLSQGYPAICLCVTKGGRVHTTEEYINIDFLPQGFVQLMGVIEHFWDKAG